MRNTKKVYRRVAEQKREDAHPIPESIRRPMSNLRRRKFRSRSRISGNQPTFPVVGVGASAGGLDAFTRLIKNLPVETGMAFVLVQHLDPTHRSILTEILSKATSMPVKTVKNGTRIQPNHIYVIPPNVNMATQGGVLKLMPRSATNGLHMPIDYFFRSLAADRKNMAIGVILSGTGSDGALAMEMIKSEGGITFAQDYVSAKFSDMPRNAVATEHVDFIFTPERIARKLSLLAPRLRAFPLRMPVATAPPERDLRLQDIFRMVRIVTGMDFSQYKHSTLQRRIERRLALNDIKKLSDYSKLLRAKPEEVRALSQEFLIPVTSFFRDPFTFETLKKTVFPRLLKNQTTTPLRIWVPGCSTGQEAYSLAICLLEFLGKKAARIPIQIFASDVSEGALEKARAGVYVENIALDVSPKRLKKFFFKVGHSYQVTKAVRDLCIFAKQNVAQDPPFSQLDFISCRNALIYFTADLQKKVLHTFHYALKPTGMLMLGKSETVGTCTDLFSLVDKKAKIYARKTASARPHLRFSTPVFEASDSLSARTRQFGKNASASPFSFREEADKITLTRFAPAGVIINEDMEILEFRGDTSAYLKPSPGKASLHLLKMARDGLLVELHSALKKVLKSNVPLRREGVRMGNADHVSFDILPLGVSSGQRCFLVLFQHSLIASAKKSKKKTKNEDFSVESQLIVQLEQELSSARSYLQSVIREHEVATEELQAANEEALSSNEEFQSTNEELETSKEELQSTNEELSTVNEELQNRNTEMGELNRSLALAKDYNDAILKTVREPLLVLDSELRVQFANQSFYRTFKAVEEKTLKRLVYDLGSGEWNIPELRQLLEDIIVKNTHFDDLKVVYAFPQGGRRSMLLNARMIHLHGAARERLILLAIEDVTEKEEQEERTHLQILHDMLLNIPMAGLAVSARRGTLHLNEQFCLLMNLDPSRYLHRQLMVPDIINQLQDQVADPKSYERKLRSIWNMTESLLEQEIQLIDGRVLLCDYNPVFHGNVHVGHLLLFRDITRQRRIEAAKSEFMSLASHQLRTPLTSIRWALGRLGKRLVTQQHNTLESKLLAEGKRAATRMSDTIDTMLQIARVESGEMEMNFSRITLRTFLRRVILEGGMSNAKNHSISFSCPAGLSLRTDPKLLKEIIQNLFDNALKYTPKGGKIALRVKSKKGAVTVEVQDSGCGIPLHQQKKIFQKFFRGDNVVGNDTEGTGLGLYLVFLITNLLGGKISFISRLGKKSGTTFTLSLPRTSPAR